MLAAEEVRLEQMDIAWIQRVFFIMLSPLPQLTDKTVNLRYYRLLQWYTIRVELKVPFVWKG
jgi:hypothetical protein